MEKKEIVGTTEELKKITEIWREKPELFFKQCLDDKRRWIKQLEIIESVRKNRETFVKSAHGLGKTHTAKDVIMWFLFTHIPSKVITTAPSWPQVEKLLWAEINNSFKQSKLKLWGNCLTTELKIRDDWFAIGLSPKIENEDDGSRMTGFHSENILVVFDEAPAINPKIWKIKETLLTSQNCKFLAIGNPVSDSGDFFEGFRKSNIGKITMSLFDSPNFVYNGIDDIKDLEELAKNSDEELEKIYPKMRIPHPYLTTPRWAVERLKDWKKDSPIFISRVLGDFPKQGKDTIISLSDLEACRYITPSKGLKVLSVDVARYGVDNTVFFGYENGIQNYKEVYNGQDLVYTANKVLGLVRQYKYNIVVIDDTGLGGGVTDIVKNNIHPDIVLIPVNFAESAFDKEVYDGIVTEMYYIAKKKIEDREIRVEDQGHLFKQLTSRKYKFTNKGLIKIESKDDYKKRTGLESPDEGDAFVLNVFGQKYGRLKREIASEDGAESSKSWQ